MPRKRMRKRRQRRRRRQLARPAKLLSSGTAFPEVARIKVNYSDLIKLSTTAGLQANHVFRCNSIFDPDFTGVGHQPYLHDELATLWTRYKVVSSKMTIQASSSNFNHPITVGIARRNLAGVYTLPGTVNEQPHTKYRTVGGDDVARVSLGFNSSKHFNRSADPAELSAGFGANPIEAAYYIVYGYMNNPAAATDIDVNVSLTFTLVLTDSVIRARS